MITNYRSDMGVDIQKHSQDDNIATLIERYIDCINLSEEIYARLTTTGTHIRDSPANTHLIRKMANTIPWTHDEIQIFLLWGGSKSSESHMVDNVDKETIDYLEKQDIIRDSKKIQFDILFCDSHHYLCNGVEETHIKTYDATLKQYLYSVYYDPESQEHIDRHHLTMQRLSDIIKKNMFGDDISWGASANNVARERTRALFENKQFADKCIAAMKKHSTWYTHFSGIKNNDSCESALAQLYVETEIDFLYRIGHNDWKSTISSYQKNAPVVFISLSNPEIQKPIAEAAEVPMLFFWPREGRHAEVPWYRQDP